MAIQIGTAKLNRPPQTHVKVVKIRLVSAIDDSRYNPDRSTTRDRTRHQQNDALTQTDRGIGDGPMLRSFVPYLLTAKQPRGAATTNGTPNESQASVSNQSNTLHPCDSEVPACYTGCTCYTVG